MSIDASIGDREVAQFKRFLELLPHNEDLTLVVLKGHLLIEEQLRAIVRERVVLVDALDEADLTAHQALCLAKAHVGRDEDNELWNALHLLNKLRNLLAHQLDPKGVADRAAAIARLMRADRWSDTPQVQFEFALWAIFSELLGLQRKPRGELVRLAWQRAT